MKRIVSILLVVILSTAGLAAQESLRDVVKEFQRNNSEFTLVIPSFLIKLGLAYGDMEDEEREVLKMIDNMKIVVSESNFRKADFSLLDEGIKNGSFVEVMTVRERDENVRMVMNQKSKRKSEMLMLVESNDENVLLLFDFHGEPDFSKFVSLAN
ncbi:MAG: DUF4252 domain-containing protein [Bacteroidetes bacterium]|nr:DUF4252 domain-containing protein [Bacteroidota bacterium]